MPRIVVLAMILFLLYAINSDPQGTGASANDFLDVVGDAFDSALLFLDGLFESSPA